MLVALGVVMGALITDWRGTGRSLTTKRIAIADLRSRLQSINANTQIPAIKRKALMMIQTLRRLDAAEMEGGDHTAGVAEVAARCDTLDAARTALEAVTTLEGEAKDLHDGVSQRLIAAFDAADWDTAAINTAHTALRAEIADLPTLVLAIRELDAAMARFSWASDLIVGMPGPTADLWHRLIEARKEAFHPLPLTAATGTASAERAAGLSSLADEIAAKSEEIFATLIEHFKAALKPDTMDGFTALAAGVNALSANNGAIALRLKNAADLLGAHPDCAPKRGQIGCCSKTPWGWRA